MGDTLWLKRLETVLKGNWSLLKRGLSMDGLADQLIENDLITSDSWLDLRNRQMSTSKKVETYLGDVTRFSEIKFTTFLTVLEKCEYNDIADTLRKCLENTKKNTTGTQTGNIDNVHSQDDDTQILQQRIGELQDKICNLEEAKCAAEAERQEEINKAQKINELMVQKETELADLKVKIKFKETANETYALELNKAREEIDQLRVKEHELKQEKTLQIGLLAQLDERKQDLQQEKYLRKELETQLEKNEQDLQQEKSLQKDLEVKLKQKEQELQQQESLQKDLQGQMEKREQAFHELYVKLQKAQSDLIDQKDKFLEMCLDKDAELQTTKIELEKEKSKGLELERSKNELLNTLNAEREKVRKKKEELKEREKKREDKIVEIENIRIGLEREKTTLSENFQEKNTELVRETTKLSKELESMKRKVEKKKASLEKEKQCRENAESNLEQTRISMKAEMEEAFKTLQNENSELRLKITRLEQDPATWPIDDPGDDAINTKIKEIDEKIIMMTAQKKVLSKRLNSKRIISSVCSIM